MSIVNQVARDLGQRTEKLASTYFSQIAMLMVIADPRSMRLAPPQLLGHSVPIGYVERKDGTSHAFHFPLFLERAREDANLEEFRKVWLAGAILTIGDELSAYGYFDHAPELELLYHLRNGIAHGNKFNITSSGRERLERYPAHNRLAWIKSDTGARFEIDLGLQGQVVLFDFLGPGDVLDLLQSVGLYLIRLGNGDPLRPETPVV